MYYVLINESNHVWEKKNLVTIFKNGKHYDEYQCKNCGMKGKRYSLEVIVISGRVNSNHLYNCKNYNAKKLPAAVRVIFCEAVGSQFSNLAPGSVHTVITPPAGYKNDYTGVWVMGNGEPVKLLKKEYDEID